MSKKEKKCEMQQLGSFSNLTSTGPNFECTICGRTFIRDSYLIRHQNRCHRELNDDAINDTINAVVQAVGDDSTSVFDESTDLRWNSLVCLLNFNSF